MEKSLVPRATISPANIFLGNPKLFSFPGNTTELSRAACELVAQQTQELSDHSPGVQARGASHRPAACPLLRGYHLFWVALPLPSTIPPQAEIPSDFASQAGSGLMKIWMGMPRTTKASGSFPKKTVLSQATCWQPWRTDEKTMNGTAADPPWLGGLTGISSKFTKTIFEERLALWWFSNSWITRIQAVSCNFF